MTDATDEVAGAPAPAAGANASPTTDAPADAEREDTGSAADSPPAAENDGDSRERAIKDLQQRVHKTTRNWRETERERDYWRDVALKAQQPQATTTPEAAREAPTTPKPDDLPPRPTREQFGWDDEKYDAALDEYHRAVAKIEARREAESLLRSERAKEAAEQQRKAHLEKIEAFRKETPDFDEVALNPDLPVSAAMASVLQKHELGPAMAYELGKNLDRAAEIAQLDAADAAFELGLIAAEIRARKAAPKAPPPPVVPKAPPPPPTLEAADGSPPVRTTDPSGDSLSDQEWARRERLRIARKAQRK